MRTTPRRQEGAPAQAELLDCHTLGFEVPEVFRLVRRSRTMRPQLLTTAGCAPLLGMEQLRKIAEGP